MANTDVLGRAGIQNLSSLQQQCRPCWLGNVHRQTDRMIPRICPTYSWLQAGRLRIYVSGRPEVSEHRCHNKEGQPLIETGGDRMYVEDSTCRRPSKDKQLRSSAKHTRRDTAGRHHLSNPCQVQRVRQRIHFLIGPHSHSDSIDWQHLLNHPGADTRFLLTEWCRLYEY